MNLSRFPSNIALILIPDTGKTLTGRRLPKYIVNKTPKSDQKTRSRQYFIETWSLLIQGRNPDCDQNGGVRNSKHYYATIVSRTSTTSQGVLFKCNKALFQINRPAIGRANPLVFVAGSRTGQKWLILFPWNDYNLPRKARSRMWFCRSQLGGEGTHDISFKIVLKTLRRTNATKASISDGVLAHVSGPLPGVSASGHGGCRPRSRVHSIGTFNAHTALDNEAHVIDLTCSMSVGTLELSKS